MFERFTERARQVVVLAQEEARLLKHDYIGTEHILLGLISEQEGVATHVLESLGLTPERARSEVVRIAGSGDEVRSGQIPFTPRAKTVLELGLREALSLSHDYIGTEHILLGLVREQEGVAARVLIESGGDLEKVRDEVMRAISGPGRRRPAGKRRGRRKSQSLAAGVELEDALLEGTWPLLVTLAGEIEQRLGRPADAGDLLVALASMPTGLAARTLGSLGVDPEALARAAEETRRGGADPSPGAAPELAAEIDRVRADKEEALGAQEFDRAAELRDQERELARRVRDAERDRLDQVLDDVRGRLGLTGG